jgi:imidazoleglycerol-phosphate dehydratase
LAKIRQATVKRTTRETDIRIELLLDGAAGEPEIQSGVAFFDHMLHAFSCHGGFGLRLAVKGDLEVDAHHTMEDVGLALGQTLKEALGDKRGLTRFGASFVPMDESLARVVLDLSGRPHLSWRVSLPEATVGGVSGRLFREFFQALVNSSGLTLHVDLLACEESHHGMEAIFKAFGRALAQAVTRKAGSTAVPSTKGVLE